MLRDTVKILHALFCAAILMTFIGGGISIGAENAGHEKRSGLLIVGKGVKPATLVALRAPAACPLATAIKAVGGRVWEPAPGEILFIATTKIRSGACEHGARREPEREPIGRMRVSGMRLLI